MTIRRGAPLPVVAALAWASLSACGGAGSPAAADGCAGVPAPEAGITWTGEKRFIYGTNWAWRNFGGDFGGISAWGQAGVSASSGQYANDLGAMKAAGVSVVRWWMFPRFFTDSITFGADGAPSGIGGTLVADVQEALALAEQQDVYIVLTLFSFDSFTPTAQVSGVDAPGLQPIVIDASKRKKLLDNLVAPVARAAESSPHRMRMIAWDMINEPEWAMTGPSLYGGEGFTPQSGLQSVTHGQMETFLNDTAAALHANSSALVSIGSAAIKWADAWSQVNVDFYQLHYYDWVYEWYPYTTVTLQSAGLVGKPVVMGEFPNDGLSAIATKGLPARTAAQLAADLLAYGYAGALSWAYDDSLFPWVPEEIKSFADEHRCEITY